MTQRADLGEGDDVESDSDDYVEDEEGANSEDADDAVPHMDSPACNSLASGVPRGGTPASSGADLALLTPRAPACSPPRMLVSRRSTTRTTAGLGEGELLVILKMQMLEDRARREEEREARAEERAQQREEERARREREDRRHDQFMHTLLLAYTQPGGRDGGSSTV